MASQPHWWQFSSVKLCAPSVSGLRQHLQDSHGSPLLPVKLGVTSEVYRLTVLCHPPPSPHCTAQHTGETLLCGNLVITSPKLSMLALHHGGKSTWREINRRQRFAFVSLFQRGQLSSSPFGHEKTVRPGRSGQRKKLFASWHPETKKRWGLVPSVT